MKKVGLPTFYLDGTHCKHNIFDGVMLLLVGRDSNNHTVPVAVLICRSEDGDSYETFAKECKAAGIVDVLQGENSITAAATEDDAAAQAGAAAGTAAGAAAAAARKVFNGEPPVFFCDRAKGMHKFFDIVDEALDKKAVRLNCCLHLFWNVRAQVRRSVAAAHISLPSS